MLDWDHCLDDFAPCRDVVHARDAFSDPPGSTAKPRAQPTDVFTQLGPEAQVPRRIDIPGRGRGALKELLWNLDYMIVLVARRGELIVPLGHTPVQMLSLTDIAPTGDTLRTSSNAGVPFVIRRCGRARRLASTSTRRCPGRPAGCAIR